MSNQNGQNNETREQRLAREFEEGFQQGLEESAWDTDRTPRLSSEGKKTFFPDVDVEDLGGRSLELGFDLGMLEVAAETSGHSREWVAEQMTRLYPDFDVATYLEQED